MGEIERDARHDGPYVWGARRYAEGTQMALLALVGRNMGTIKKLGVRAIEDARRDGVPAVYVDPALGPWIVREMPDGTRERFERRDGEVVVLERFGPRPQA